MRNGFAIIELLLVLVVLLFLGGAIATTGYHFAVSPLGWKGWLAGTCGPAGLFIAFLLGNASWNLVGYYRWQKSWQDQQKPDKVDE